MKDNLMMLSLGVGLLSIAATESLAQGANCAPRDRVIERLAEAYGETRQSIGLGTNNSLIEVFASGETGTWTITMTLASGVTCLMASGQAFEKVREEQPVKKSDA